MSDCVFRTSHLQKYHQKVHLSSLLALGEWTWILMCCYDAVNLEKVKYGSFASQTTAKRLTICPEARPRATNYQCQWQHKQFCVRPTRLFRIKRSTEMVRDFPNNRGEYVGYRTWVVVKAGFCNSPSNVALVTSYHGGCDVAMTTELFSALPTLGKCFWTWFSCFL